MIAVLALPLLLLQPRSDYELLIAILRATEPLDTPRGERLPLYLWPAQSLGTTDENEIVDLLKKLDARGMTAVASLQPGARSLAEAVRLGRLQKRLGLPISVNATALTYGFYDGDPKTAHVDAAGEPFFDSSFRTERKMGCPFAIDHRLPEIAGGIRRAVEAYREAGLTIDFLYADWEVDGPLEWNGAWESSKRCTRCRRHIPDIERFEAFQGAIRKKRSALQKEMLSRPVLETFPDALVGNYGVYPHDGYRYWLDYFEEHVDAAPVLVDGRARYRKWYPEFEETGFTFAMPVTYPWYRGFDEYDFESSDYRWFYNMLLVGTNAAKSTPASIPIITFVHWHTTEPPAEPDPRVRQLGRETYQELLWHLLLRGHDALFLWSPKEEAFEESRLVYQVYRESHAYRAFLLEGTPVTFDVPKSPGPVVSALRKGSSLLVRRTDFDESPEPVVLAIDGGTVSIPPGEGSRIVVLR